MHKVGTCKGELVAYEIFSFDSAHIVVKLIAANTGINGYASPGSTDASVFKLDTSPLDEYQTVNEISEEVRELIVSSENSRRSKDSGFCCGFDQVGPMQHASGTHEIVESKPPPQRYRRVSRKTFMG